MLLYSPSPSALVRIIYPLAINFFIKAAFVIGSLMTIKQESGLSSGAQVNIARPAREGLFWMNKLRYFSFWCRMTMILPRAFFNSGQPLDNIAYGILAASLLISSGVNRFDPSLLRIKESN